MTAGLPAPEGRRGHSTAEAARLLAAHGPNEPVPVRRLSALVQFLRLFANPLVLILVVASALSIVLGRGADAAIVMAMVLLGVTISFWQTYRAQQAADLLRASVTPTATVLRDGAWQEIAVRTVVPGDLVRLSAGDLVPADARLIESRDLSVQQSMLTGESLPCDKHASATGGAGPDAPDLVFLGTSVVSGTATALVLRTGVDTLFGDMAARLAARAPETEFEHGLRRFSLLILRTTIVLVLFILLVAILLRRDPLESLLFAVALGGRPDAGVPADDRVGDAHQGRDPHGARARHRQAPAGDPEPRQHRRPVQRQDRHAHDGRDADSTASSTPGERGRSAVRARARQQPVPDGDQEPARRRDPGAAADRGRHLDEDRRDSLRLRAPPPVGRRRHRGSRRRAASARHQGRARDDPRTGGGRRDRRPGDAARRPRPREVRRRAPRAQRRWPPRDRRRLPLARAARLLHARRRDGAGRRRLHRLRRSRAARHAGTSWRR